MFLSVEKIQIMKIPPPLICEGLGQICHFKKNVIGQKNEIIHIQIECSQTDLPELAKVKLNY